MNKRFNGIVIWNKSAEYLSDNVGSDISRMIEGAL